MVWVGDLFTVLSPLDSLMVYEWVVRVIRLERTTNGLKVRYSTIELHAHVEVNLGTAPSI